MLSFHILINTTGLKLSYVQLMFIQLRNLVPGVGAFSKHRFVNARHCLLSHCWNVYVTVIRRVQVKSSSWVDHLFTLLCKATWWL